VFISLDDARYLDLARTDPMGLVAELPDFVTIDEIQRAPELILAIKHSVDLDRRSGRFLLTGSANLLQLPRLADSLAGRMECLYLLPFSESEKELGNGRFLEKLFLIRTLPAWHRNAGKRLVKSTKIHVCDSGLAATLSDLNADQWIGERNRFGHLLESFIVQQLVSQAGATQPDLHFWHYRDRDQVEVDCVISRGRKVWGIEIKAARTVTAADTKGLHRLAEISGSDFQGGMVFYDGESILPLANGAFLAMPISKLWEL
jgi:predicted AAA+ superfamily ATPase